MKKTFLMKAHTFGLGTDVSGWYMSRKLNGFAVLWDGGVTRGMAASEVDWYVLGGDNRFKHKVYSTGLWSSNGKVIEAPDWWLDRLPKYIPLQGEIWCDDNKSIAAVCNTKIPTDKRWSMVKFQVYNYKPYSLLGVPKGDLTLDCYYNKSWLQRMEKIILLANDEKFNSIGSVVKQIKVENESHLHYFVQLAIQEKAWEGVMLINPNSNYEDCRSHNLLKVKPSYETEAEIIDYQDGTGKHKNRMGALVVKLTWDDKVTTFHGGREDLVGKTIYFNIGGGFTDQQREWDYVSEYFPRGAIVNFSFNEIGSLGAPPSASFNSVRR